MGIILGPDIYHDPAGGIDFERAQRYRGACDDMDIDGELPFFGPDHIGSLHQLTVEQRVGYRGPVDAGWKVDANDADRLVVFDSNESYRPCRGTIDGEQIDDNALTAGVAAGAQTGYLSGVTGCSAKCGNHPARGERSVAGEAW